jgi:ankyrin repeat protein
MVPPSQPLLAASRAGDTKEVARLLQNGADVDEAMEGTCSGATSLHLASLKGHAEVARLLVDSGADKAKECSSDGFTPLLMACQKGHVEMVRVLLDSGANKDKAASDDVTPLLIACYKGPVEVVKLLVDSGAEKDHADIRGDTPLHMACLEGHAEMVRILVDNGAVQNKAANDGLTPLRVAKHKGHGAVVQVLEAWDNLTEGQRQAILAFGRQYYNMAPWREGRHQEYPSHLRGQAAALAMCIHVGDGPIAALRGNPLSLLVGAIHCRC